MVLGHVGRGDEEHGLLHQTELRNRAGAAARNHQIGRRISVVHPFDEGPLPDVLRGVGLQKLLHLPFVKFTRLPDHLHGRFAPLQRQPGLHHLVQRPRPQRAAHHEQHGPVVRESVMGQRLRSGGPLLRETAAQGVARQHDLLLREETLHPVVGHADAMRPPGQDLVGHAGVGVLLLNHGRHPHPLGGPEHGSRGIAAETHRDVGAEIADRPAGFRDALHHLEGYGEVVPVHPPLQPGDRQPHDPVAQRRDLLHLHLALGPHEEDLHPVAPLAFQRLGDRHGRVDMSARSASGKYHFFHRYRSFYIYKIPIAPTTRGPATGS